MKPKIGFMGLGIMGGAMAANVHRAGFPLMVYNRSAHKAEKFAALGVGVASSPRSLAHATDVMILMVTGPQALDALFFGPDGAHRSLDAQKTVINMSSVSPAYTRSLADRLAPTGCAFIDAPVSGTKKPAEEGALIILAGGDRAKVDEVTPILSAMGKKVVYCGEAGQGSMMKMTVNLLLGLMMASFSESVHFGLSGGLSLETILDVILSGPLSCGLYQMKSEMMKANDFPAQFPLKHMTKDAKFIIDTAYETGAAAPLGHLLLHLYRLGVSKGLGDDDFAAIAKVIAGLKK
jgi:3-hydroxyisobutyrate dehydrogenase-like beta-hydroxyacid dehydrogenase